MFKYTSVLAVFGVAFICSSTSLAMDLTQTHDPLTLDVGLSAWGFDTGWLGVNLAFGAVYVELSGSVGGTVLDVALNGQGGLTFPTGPNMGDLWFLGATNGGNATQDLGVQMSGKWKVVIGSNEYTGDLPYVPSTDIRFNDAKTFTPYMLGQTVTLQDSISNLQLYDVPIGVSGILAGHIGVSLSGSDTVGINFESLHTDPASFTVENQRQAVAVTGPTLTVANIYENLGITPSMTLTPNITLGIQVWPLPIISTSIPTFPITVPLASLLQPEYPTTPPRTIVFNVPPTVTQFAIDNGDSHVFNNIIVLNNTSTNSPTDYMASEDPGFAGAPWLPYNTAPTFITSPGDGDKTVYFKTRNAAGESVAVNDTITVTHVRPTVTPLVTRDSTPPLTGTVSSPEASISVTVATQTVAAINNHDGTWVVLDNTLTPLADGVYDVQVTATDSLGNSLSDTTTDELVVDTIGPLILVNGLITSNRQPHVTGTVNDSVSLTSFHVVINGVDYWPLPVGTAWSVDVSAPLPDGQYDVQVTATDSVGQAGHDWSVNELTIDTVAPVVTVNSLITSDRSPGLTGMLDDPLASISVQVNGVGYSAHNNGDGTWSLAQGIIATLAQGRYDVVATALDAAGNAGHDATTNELTIDYIPPTLGVNFLTTANRSPQLSGQVTDLTTTTVTITVNGQTFPAINNGYGSWNLPAGVLTPLPDGVYDVLVTGIDAAGNIGFDTTVNELTIDTVPPVVTVDTLLTNDPQPPLSGTIDDSAATISVTVGTQAFQALNVYGQNRWVLARGNIGPLAAGVYDVRITATDHAGNQGQDATTNELTIDLTPPTVTFDLLSPNPTGADAVTFRATFSKPVSPTFAAGAITLTGSLAASATVALTPSDPIYTLVITLTNPDADGTIGFQVAPGTVHDLAGNFYGGGSSPLYTIKNWTGFSVQPQNQRAYTGDTSTFTVAPACGDGGILYQWYWRTGAKTVQNGPTTAIWVLNNIAQANEGDYWCDATYDSLTYHSAAASLAVADRIQVTLQPQGGSIREGNSFDTGVAATGGYPPLQYQWKKDGAAISGATNASLSINVVQKNDAGAYTVEITDANTDAIASDAAQLTVTPNLPVYSTWIGLITIVLLVLAAAAYQRRTQNMSR